MQGIRRLTAAVLVGASFAVGAGAPTGAAAPPPPVVPSLEPEQTQAEWAALVRARSERPEEPAAPGSCRPLRAVFYTATDWLRLTTKLATTPSPCAEYYISIPPLVSDKSQPRPDQAWRIRALGPAYHAAAEMNVTGW